MPKTPRFSLQFCIPFSSLLPFRSSPLPSSRRLPPSLAVKCEMLFLDDILHDGEQSPGATMTSGEKSSARLVTLLRDAIREAPGFLFPVSSPDDLDACLPFICNTGDITLHKLRKTHEQLEAYARSVGCYDVEFSPEDAGRVNHPLHQKASFADQKFPDGSLGCLMPVSKKTSSFFSVTSGSEDNGKSGPYDSSMTVAKGNFRFIKETFLELEKVYLDLNEVFWARQSPAISVEKIPTDPQHLRGLSWAAKNNNQQGDYILMVNGGGGADGAWIMDSGGSVHASGNISFFTDLKPEPRETTIFAANKEEMLCFGYGPIRNPRLGLELGGAYYVPCMGNKTIVSVSKLNELGYCVSFSRASCSITDERTWPRKLVGEGHLVDGQFVLDYLKISLNRAPVSDGTLTLLWRDIWMRWNRFTGYLYQRDGRLPR